MKEIFADPLIGTVMLVIFFVMFLAAAIWAYRPGSKQIFDAHARIPLQEVTDDRTE